MSLRIEPKDLFSEPDIRYRVVNEELLKRIRDMNPDQIEDLYKKYGNRLIVNDRTADVVFWRAVSSRGLF